jgi:hypothetical protein
MRNARRDAVIAERTRARSALVAVFGELAVDARLAGGLSPWATRCWVYAHKTIVPVRQDTVRLTFRRNDLTDRSSAIIAARVAAGVAADTSASRQHHQHGSQPTRRTPMSMPTTHVVRNTANRVPRATVRHGADTAQKTDCHVWCSRLPRCGRRGEEVRPCPTWCPSQRAWLDLLRARSRECVRSHFGNHFILVLFGALDEGLADRSAAVVRRDP